MSRSTCIFAGPPGSAEMVMSIVETALGRSFIRLAGSDPYIRADPLAVYMGGHDFDDGDVYSPAGTPIALKTTYPILIDIRDTERNLQRQQDAAARIFAAIKAAKQTGGSKRSTSTTCSTSSTAATLTPSRPADSATEPDLHFAHGSRAGWRDTLVASRNERSLPGLADRPGPDQSNRLRRVKHQLKLSG